MRALRFVIGWILSGIAIGAVVAFAAATSVTAVLGEHSEPFDLRPILGSGIYYLGVFLSFFGLVAPGVLAFCIGWPFLAKRFPAFESPTLFLCAVSAAAALSTVGVWVAYLGQGTDFRVLALPFAASWLPLALPRLVLRPLKLGRSWGVAA